MTSTRRIDIGILLLSTALLVLALGRSTTAPQELAPEPGPRSTLECLPKESMLAVTVDLKLLRQTSLGPLLLDAGRSLGDLGSLRELCGFDPLADVHQVSVGVSKTHSEMGVAALGELKPDALSACARTIIERRGERPIAGQVDGFSTVRSAAGHGAELAVRPGGPLLHGEGAYLRAMIDTVRGRNDSVAGAPLHAALRRELGSGLVIGTWTPTPGWLSRLGGSPLLELSPLSKVRALGLRLDASPLKLRALLGCADPGDCQRLAALARDVQRPDNPAGLPPVIHRLIVPMVVRDEARVVRLETVLDRAGLAALLSELGEQR